MGIVCQDRDCENAQCGAGKEFWAWDPMDTSCCPDGSCVALSCEAEDACIAGYQCTPEEDPSCEENFPCIAYHCNIDNTTSCTLESGMQYAFNATWQNHNCSECTCGEDGAISCNPVMRRMRVSDSTASLRQNPALMAFA